MPSSDRLSRRRVGARQRAVLAALYSACWATLATALLLVLATLGDAAGLYWSVVGIVGVLVLLRGLRISLTVTTEQIIIKNVWRTYTVRMDRMSEVGETDRWMSPAAIFTNCAVAFITTTDGKRHVIQASMGNNVDPEIVRVLKAVLRHR